MSVLSLGGKPVSIGGHGIGLDGAGQAAPPGHALASFAGPAGAAASGMVFSGLAGPPAAGTVDGHGNLVLQPGGGFAFLPAAAGDGVYVVTLAAPSQISFAARASVKAATADAYYTDGAFIGALKGGGYERGVTGFGPALPTASTWVFEMNAGSMTYGTAGAVQATSVDSEFPAGGFLGIRALPGGPALVQTIEYYPLADFAAAHPASPYAVLPITGLRAALNTLSTAALAGARVGTLSSTTPTGNHAYTLTGPDAAAFYLDGSGVFLAKDHPPLGTYHLTINDADRGETASADVAIPVVQGNTLPGSAITFAVPALANNRPPGLVATPAVTGLSGAVQWRVVNPGASQVGVSTRWVADPAGGGVSNTMFPTTGADTILLIASNGVDVCSVPVSMQATAVAGPVLDVGAGQTYAKYGDACSHLFERAVSGVSGPDDGAVIRLHPNPDPRYYFGQMDGSGSAAFDRSRGLAYGGYVAPYSIVGVPDPATGALPSIGGAQGYYGKGAVLLTQNRDMAVRNAEVAWAFGNNNIAGIKGDGGTAGTILLDNLYIHNNNDGYLGERQGDLLVSNSVLLMNGTGDAGYTHNLYMDHFQSIVSNVLSLWVNGGHALKGRSLTGRVSDSVFGDGIVGRGSAVCDMPQAGDWEYNRCQFVKGPMAQNNAMIQFGVESLDRRIHPTDGFPRNPGARLHFVDCDFICLYGDPYGNGGANGIRAKSYYGEALVDLITRAPLDISFTNCRVFGITPANFLVQEDGRPLATAYPPGVTAMAEPPPLDFRSKLLPGTPILAPAAWTAPNKGRYSNWNPAADQGVIEAGVHEIRVPRATPVGAKVAQLKAWGRTEMAATDPAYDPWGSGATWSNGDPAASFTPSAYFSVHADGGIYVAQDLMAAPVLHLTHPAVDSADHLHKTDAVMPVLVTDVPARTDCIPAPFTHPVRPLGQEALG